MSIQTDNEGNVIDSGPPWDHESRRDNGRPYRKRANTKMLKAFHSSEEVVNMIICKDQLYVATNRMVYHVIDDVLVKLTIQLVDDQ